MVSLTQGTGFDRFPGLDLVRKWAAILLRPRKVWSWYLLPQSSRGGGDENRKCGTTSDMGKKIRHVAHDVPMSAT